MKKCRFFSILSFLMVVLLTLGMFAGCTNNKQGDDVNPTLSEDATGDVLNEVKNMEAVFDGIIFSMRSKNTGFTPDNPDFVWTGIYFMVANYAYADANIEETEDETGYNVGSDTIKYYAETLAGKQTDLSKIPGDLGIVEQADGGYFVSASEQGQAYIGIEGAQANDDSTVSAYVALIENDALICEYVFTLKQNSAAPIDKGPVFRYTVSNVEIVEEEYAAITDVEEDGDQTYVTIDYVEPIFHKANDKDDLDLNGNMYTKDTVYVKNDSEESAKLLIDEDTFLVMGDIFGDKASFTNVFTSKDYFTANCTKEYSGEPLYFKVNKMGEKLLSATLWYEYYFS